MSEYPIKFTNPLEQQKIDESVGRLLKQVAPVVHEGRFSSRTIDPDDLVLSLENNLHPHQSRIFGILEKLGRENAKLFTIDSTKSMGKNADDYLKLFRESDGYVHSMQRNSGFDTDGITYWGKPTRVGGKSDFMMNEMLRRGLSVEFVKHTVNKTPFTIDSLPSHINVWDEIPVKMGALPIDFHKNWKQKNELSEVSMSIRHAMGLISDNSIESPLALSIRKVQYDGGGGGRHDLVDKWIEFKTRNFFEGGRRKHSFQEMVYRHLLMP